MSHLACWLEAASSDPELSDSPALLTAQRGWSYAELADYARRGRFFLRGAQPDDPPPASPEIAAIAGNSLELALSAIACAAADLALLPLDPATAEQRWPALQRLGEAHSCHLRRLSPLPAELPQAPQQALPPPAGSRLALLIATSGSEGAPKAVLLTQGNLDAAARASNLHLPLNRKDLWLDCLPLHHIGGMAILYRCLRAGAGVLLHAGFDAASVWRDLHAHPVSHLSLVPAMLARLLDHAGRQPAPPGLRYALIGGAALSRPLFERALAQGWPLCPTWGMSETAAQAATRCLPGADWQAGEVGTLLPGLEGRIGADGRIELRGAQVFAGYLGETDAPRRDGWLRTADLGQIADNGQLTILGRADDVFISGGVNVHPAEIEACLAACPGVVDVAVTALPDPVWGDALLALYVGKASPDAVREWSRRHLAAALRPRRIGRVETLPRTALGKIERPALRALAATLPDAP